MLVFLTSLSVLVFIINVLFISFRWGLLGPSCNEMSGNCFCTACHHQYATMELNMIKFTPGFVFFFCLYSFFHTVILGNSRWCKTLTVLKMYTASVNLHVQAAENEEAGDSESQPWSLLLLASRAVTKSNRSPEVLEKDERKMSFSPSNPRFVSGLWCKQNKTKQKKTQHWVTRL